MAMHEFIAKVGKGQKASKDLTWDEAKQAMRLLGLVPGEVLRGFLAFADLGYKFMHGHSSSPSDSGSHVSTESGSEGRESDQLSRMTVHVLMCNPHSVFSKFFHR